MADVDEIRAYVESHPDDHKQRWRLAKKLYNAWDYRSALEQLEKLREVWPDQVPVLRYLAATHFRLGQYDKAADLLVETIQDHPDDVSLMEQLAKVHEGAGQTEKAIDVWNRVMALKPSREAEEALERLGMSMGTMASTFHGGASGQEVSDHGDDTLINCPHCGAGNDVFSQRCARCHGDFDRRAASDVPREATPRRSTGIVLLVIISFLVLSGLSVAAFFWLAGSN
jgi:tetratricopeptide (TPR) repeat protein